jgi:hypothetical protein
MDRAEAVIVPTDGAVGAEVAKILLSMTKLHRRALAEIRTRPGCHNVQDIAINRVRNGRAANNWSMCVLSAGAADALRSMYKVFCAAITISWKTKVQAAEGNLNLQS